MNKDRKNLKEYSIVILLFAVFSLIRMIVDLCVFGFNASSIPVEGADEKLVQIATIIIAVIAFLLLFPDIYVGIRGIKEANNPTNKRSHIVWALILTVLSSIATISSVVDIITSFNFGKLLEVIDVAVDVVLFYAYYLTAKKVANKK